VSIASLNVRFLTINALLLGLAATAVAAEIAGRQRIVDMHAHFFRMAPEAVVKSMDEEGVSVAVFMPVPNAGRSRRRGVSEDFYLDAAKAYPDRLVAFFGGNELNQEFESTRAGNVSNGDKERFRQHVEPILAKGEYKGIGELGPRHIAYRAGMREIEYAADHPLMLVLSDLAAKYELPIDVHLEANDRTVPQLERLLAHNAKSRIIWAHAGWSNTGLATPELLRQLMVKYPNLYSSIKSRQPENASQQSVRLIDEKGTLTPAWKSLFEEFPERFVIGTDVKLGDYEDYRHAGAYRRILAQLSETAARKIGWGNATILLRLKN
jgi:hypothetical protein